MGDIVISPCFNGANKKDGTTNSTIDVNGDDIDENDVCDGDPDLESVAHSRASSLSVRTP